MNRKLLLAAILLLFFSSVAFSQYSKAAVVDYQTNCTVKSENELLVKVKRLLRIDSPEGREYATIRVYYDALSPIKSLSVSVLDKNRKRIRKIKKREINDYSDLSEYLFTDDRYKEIKAFSNEYPYFIEVNYQQEYHGFFSFPIWFPQQSGNIICLNTGYELTVPKEYKIHYKFYNFHPEETITSNDDGTVTYLWKTKYISPINLTDPLSPPFISMIPRGMIVPDRFAMGGVNGSSHSWKSLGNWISELIKGLDELPAEEIIKVHRLTDTLSSDREKAKVLYQYMQKNTRYVAVIEGVGGWKPFEASYVCNNKYGDCKSLTNYMKALLKEAGIIACYSVIKAGEHNPDIDTAFVANQFNHVVLYVPLNNDTLWLECTNQETPFGYWGTFTQGKHALVCNFDKSFLVKTPVSDDTGNEKWLSAVAAITNNSIKFNTTRIIKDDEFEYINHFIKTKKTSKLATACQQLLPYNNFTVENVSYSTSSDDTAFFIEHAKLSVVNHIQRFNNEMIIKPFYKLLNLNHKLGKQRYNDIYIPNTTSKVDTIIYLIPDNYQLEYFPSDTVVTSSFGKFEQKFTLSKNKLTTVKRFVLKGSTYPLKDYPDFRAFINTILKFENQTILFKKL